ncbi:MAG: thioredoxin-like domain-containing protein [Nitrospinaceae bacterium]
MEIIHAPPLNAENLPWFNVKAPLDLPQLKGKLVVLDFWTFCCINCIHLIPTLKRLEERYSKNLVVIGVHSPKFNSEKLTENLKQAIDRYEIVHPVVHDPEFTIWKSYAVRAWPTLVFIDPDGYMLGQLPGEPDPELMMATFDKLIQDMNSKHIFQGNAADLLLPPILPQECKLLFPGKIAYSYEDDEFAIADSNHNQIVTADRDGNITRRIGSGKIGRADGTFDEVEFFRPQGLCYKEGIIWVADTENHLIRMVDLISGQVFTAAGTGKQGAVLREQGKATSQALSSPWDVSVHDGMLYFANAGTHQIGIYHVDHGTLAPFAGTGEEALKDGPRLLGAFAQTSGLSVGNEKLFLVDSETSSVRSVRLDEAGFIDTYVGTGLFDFGDRDGKGKQALLQHPLGVHYSREKVYIADSYNHKIRVLDLKTLEVSTVRASVDLLCDDKTCTRLSEPAGVLELDNCLYVSDTNNHRILKINLETEKTKIFIQ